MYSNKGFNMTFTGTCSIAPDSVTDLMRETIEQEPRYDVVIESDCGQRALIPNMKMSTKLNFAGRIPRKMKKRLKKAYGADWVYHRRGATQTISFMKTK